MFGNLFEVTKGTQYILLTIKASGSVVEGYSLTLAKVYYPEPSALFCRLFSTAFRNEGHFPERHQYCIFYQWKVVLKAEGLSNVNVV